MTQSVIGALRVNLALDSAKFERGVNRSQNSINKLRGQFALVSAAAAAMGAALGGLTISAGKAATEISRFAQVANTTPEILQKWSVGAKTVGIEQSKLADILKDVNDRVGDFVTTGGGPMADFFEKIAPRIGITADAFRGLSGPDALQLYVSSLEKANVSQEEFTFFMEAMASDSTLLLPLLKNNASEMTRLAESAESLGAIMDNKTVASLNRMNIAVGEVSLAFQGMRNRIAGEVAPSLEGLAVAFTNSMREGGFLRTATDGLIENLDRLAAYTGVLVTLIGGRLVISLAAATLGIKGMALSLATLRTAMLRVPFLALVVGAGELVLLFSKLVTATGSFGGAISALKEVALEAWDRIGEGMLAIPEFMKGAAFRMASWFADGLATMAKAFRDFLEGPIGKGLTLLHNAMNPLSQVISLFDVDPLGALIENLEKGAVSADEAARSANKLGAELIKTATRPLNSLKILNKTVEEAGKETDTTTKSVEELNKELGTNGPKAAEEFTEAMQDFRREGIGKAVDFMMEGFKGGLKSIKAMFVDTIKQMIAYAIKNKIMLSLGMGGGMAGGTASFASQIASAAGGGGGGASGGLGELIGGIGGIGASFMSGASGLITSLTGAGGGLGAAGSYMSAVLGGATSSLSGFAAAAGAIALPLAGLAAAFSFFSSKTKLLDKGLKVTTNNLGTFVKKFEKIKKTRFWGLSSKTRTSESAADAEVANPIITAVSELRSSITKAAGELGIGSRAFDRFSYKFKLSLKGLSEEEALKALNEEFVKMGDRMASIVPHVSSMNELFQVAEQRFQLQNRKLQLQGKDEELLARMRSRELDATHKLNKGLLKSIYALEDRAIAEAKAQKAAEEAAAKADERFGLERTLLQLQGNTAELRRRELLALNPANRALQVMIWGLEDAKKALDGINENDFASLFDFRKAQGLARNGIGSVSSTPIFSAGPIQATAPVTAADPSISALVNEVKAMRAEQRSLGVGISANTKKTSDTLRKFDIDGLPATRT